MKSRAPFLVLVGPDGVGKTSVAAEIVKRNDARYFHFSPPILRDWDPPEPGLIHNDESSEPSGLVTSTLRIVKAFFVFWLGYLRSVRPAVRSGTTVVADRWAYGYLAKPVSLRYHGPPWLARLVVSWLPTPDVVISLRARPAEIVSRKPELTERQAAADSLAWSTLPVEGLVHVDAEAPLDEVTDRIVELATRD